MEISVDASVAEPEKDDMSSLQDQYHCCRYTFVRSKDLNKHVQREHMLIMEVGYECRKCSLKLLSRGDFMLHFCCNHLGYCLGCTACSQACIHPNEIHTHKLHCSTIGQPETKINQDNEVSPVERKSKQLRKETCSFCGNDHQIRDCALFLKRSPQQRTTIIRSLELCYKCFSTHARNQCPNENCILCGGTHNELLCYKDAKTGKYEKRRL